jgi:hypothetical protein
MIASISTFAIGVWFLTISRLQSREFGLLDRPDIAEWMDEAARRERHAKRKGKKGG